MREYENRPLKAKESEKLFDVTSTVNMKLEGVAFWRREDKYPLFRVEWKEDGADIIYNFYHKDAPDPMDGYDDPTRVKKDERGNEVVDVKHGKPIQLPNDFVSLIGQVADHIFKPKQIHWSLELIEETCSYRMRARGAARIVMGRDQFTNSFFEIIEANILQFAPSMLTSVN